MTRARKRIAQLEGELAEARPYLGIAREIRDSVTEFAKQTDEMELVYEAAVKKVGERRKMD